MSKLRLITQKYHLENAKLARQGKKPLPSKVRKFKAPKFEIFQNDIGEWQLRFSGSQNAFPATDVEVALWLRIKELEEKLKMLA